jgi:GTP-binding protein
MVIGENMKEEDLEVNATKEKKLTNVRSTGHEEQIRLVPPRTFNVEEIISYVRDDEIVEVTPQNLRIRKRELDAGVRRKMRRDAKSERAKFL